MELAFCPTGPGGGVDNSCGREGGFSVNKQALKEIKRINKAIRAEKAKQKPDQSKIAKLREERAEQQNIRKEAKSEQKVVEKVRTEKAKEAIEESVELSSKFPTEKGAEFQDAAIALFGTTDNYKEAGFVCNDGTMLDFSGQGLKTAGHDLEEELNTLESSVGFRAFGHSNIGAINEELAEYLGDTETAPVEYMKATGAMRISQAGKEGDIGAGVIVQIVKGNGISSKQYSLLSSILENDGPIEWDITATSNKPGGFPYKFGKATTKAELAKFRLLANEGSNLGLSYSGLELAFCPTGEGGGVDPAQH